MNIIGINAYHGDASAALVCNGQLVAAVEEERFNRIKHWAGFPAQSIRWCLESAGLTAADVDHVAVSFNPRANFWRRLWFVATHRPSAGAILDRLKRQGKTLGLEEQFAAAVGKPAGTLKAQFHRIEHHQTHVAAGFLISPFDRAAVLSVDGMGDFTSTLTALAHGNDWQDLNRVYYPHSIGFLYTAITMYLGFPHYGDEYKVMGLAPYGEPEFADFFRRLIRPRGDMFELNLDYFTHHRRGIRMAWNDGAPVIEPFFSDRLVRELGPVRDRRDEMTARHDNIAKSLHDHALVVETRGQLGQKRTFVQDHAYWGCQSTTAEAQAAAAKLQVPCEVLEPAELVERTVELLTNGRVVGWFQGAMEFGARALGNRSLLADPRRTDMRDIINLRIKFREKFRPFAPSILEEHVGEWFEINEPTPYMEKVFPIRREKHAQIPAVTHVDGSGRLQTVSARTNPLYHQLISAFHKRTGVPIVLNTSLNENEPIVRTPEEAIRCFLRTDMDAIVIAGVLIDRHAAGFPENKRRRQ